MMEKKLAEITERLRAAAGANLRAVILYGSAARGQYEQQHSDLNVLCVVDRLDAPALAELADPVRWWTGKGEPPPLIFTWDELQRSADVFAIELLDIKAHHRVLYGEDCFTALDVPMDLHRINLERELRIKLLRLRMAYIAASGNRNRLLRLMMDAVTSFITLFRHALLAFGESPPEDRREVIDHLARRLSVDLAPFRTVLDIRTGERVPGDLDIGTLAGGFLGGATRVADEIDRLFTGITQGKEGE